MFIRNILSSFFPSFYTVYARNGNSFVAEIDKTTVAGSLNSWAHLSGHCDFHLTFGGTAGRIRSPGITIIMD